MDQVGAHASEVADERHEERGERARRAIDDIDGHAQRVEPSDDRRMTDRAQRQDPRLHPREAVGVGLEHRRQLRLGAAHRESGEDEDDAVAFGPGHGRTSRGGAWIDAAITQPSAVQYMNPSVAVIVRLAPRRKASSPNIGAP